MIMKRYIIPIFCMIFLLVCIIMGVKYGTAIKYNNELQEIHNSRDTRLDNYEKNKYLAESYLRIYQIVDNSSYQSVKNALYHSFSDDMQQQLFPTVNYEGVDLHRMETELIRVIGTNNGVDAKNVFLLEYNLKAVNYDQNITNLIEIEDGVITNVTRIK